jgi:hypothetical protein
MKAIHCAYAPEGVPQRASGTGSAWPWRSPDDGRNQACLFQLAQLGPQAFPVLQPEIAASGAKLNGAGWRSIPQVTNSMNAIGSFIYQSAKLGDVQLEGLPGQADPCPGSCRHLGRLGRVLRLAPEPFETLFSGLAGVSLIGLPPRPAATCSSVFYDVPHRIATGRLLWRAPPIRCWSVDADLAPQTSTPAVRMISLACSTCSSLSSSRVCRHAAQSAPGRLRTIDWPPAAASGAAALHWEIDSVRLFGE